MRAIFLAAGCTLALDGLALAPPVFLDTVDLIAVGGPLSALGTPGEGALAAGVCRLPPGWGATGWGAGRGAVGEGGRCRLPADARAQQKDPAAPAQSGWRPDGRAAAEHDGGWGRAFDRGFATGPDGGRNGSGGGDPSWPVDPGGGYSPPAVAFLGGGGGAPSHGGDRGGGTAGPSGGFSPGGDLPGTRGLPGVVLGASGAQPNGTPVPAPSSAAVLAAGLAGLAWLRRRGAARPGRDASPSNVIKL